MDEKQPSSPHSSAETILSASAEAEKPNIKSVETNLISEHCCCQQEDSPGVPLTNLNVSQQTTDQADSILPITILSDAQTNVTQSSETPGIPSTQSVPYAKDTPASSILRDIPPVDLCDPIQSGVECTNPSCPHCQPVLPASSIPQTPNVRTASNCHLVPFYIQPSKCASSGTASSSEQSERQRTSSSDDRHSDDKCRWNSRLPTLPVLHHAVPRLQRNVIPISLQTHSAGASPVRFACQSEFRPQRRSDHF